MKPFAEVIESSLHGFLAQTWQWDNFPSFGSLVSVTSNKRTHLAIVHQIKTGSMDPIRYPFPYQKTEEELLAEQPQIFEFLKTTFSCLTIGYQEKGKLFYLIAPEPVKIHAFVEPIQPDLAKQFFYSEKYLHVLFGNSGEIFNLDELLLALLKNQDQLGITTPEKVNNFMQTYSLLTGNDYRRMKLFLQRAESTILI
jgi:hypothetical protein